MKKNVHILYLAIMTLMLVTPAEAFKSEFILAGEASLSLPHDLALSPDGRYLYVADNGNDRIAVLDPGTLKVIGSIGGSELSAPHDVAFDQKGRLLVADSGNDRVVVFTVKGVRGERVAVIQGGFKRPEGVAAYPGERVYVTGAYSDNLVAFENGVKVSAFNGLSRPHDVETDDDGNILVVDSNNDRLLILAPDMQIVKTLSGVPYNFNGPRYAVYDKAGRIYVADKYAHMVKVIGVGDKLLGTIGTGKPGKDPGQLNTPEGVAVLGMDVWISDTHNNRIVLYRMFEG
ncbi:MAG: NHL repeat-containing protein [Desulfobacterales bacterium]|nr:MAG: NHL repeat-containing protein [Desulfobacterales bacterium]